MEAQFLRRKLPDQSISLKKLRSLKRSGDLATIHASKLRLNDLPLSFEALRQTWSMTRGLIEGENRSL